MRQRPHRLLEADQVFRGRQHAQHLADFRQSALKGGERARIDARLATVINSFAERFDFDFKRLYRAPRERLIELAADVGEIGTDRSDGLLDIARRLQRLDASRDLTQLRFEARKIDRGDASGSGHHRLVAGRRNLARGGRRRRERFGGRNKFARRGWSSTRRCVFAFERALARRYLGDRIVD